MKAECCLDTAVSRSPGMVPNLAFRKWLTQEISEISPMAVVVATL